MLRFISLIFGRFIVSPLADDSILDHNLKVLCRDDIPVTGGGDEDVRARRGILHRGDLESSHGSL